MDPILSAATAAAAAAAAAISMQLAALAGPSLHLSDPGLKDVDKEWCI